MFHWLWFWPFWLFFPFHGLFTLVFVIVILSLIFRRRYYYYGHPYWWHGGLPPSNSRSEALAILEGRYARGEIQRDEYLQKKHDLGG
jgi:putative membrane protein